MEDMENLMQEFIEKQEAFHLLQMQFKTGDIVL